MEAADALEGRPGPYLARVEADAALPQEPLTLHYRHGHRSADVTWTLAMEFAWAGRADRALDLLEQAMAGGSLYIPDTLPYGQSEFPPAVRNHPRYADLWRSDPRLAELARLRVHALEAGQMRGRLPDGRIAQPAPAVLAVSR